MSSKQIQTFQQLLANATSPHYRRLWQSQIDALQSQSAPPPVATSTPRTPPKFRADNERAWARVMHVLGVMWRYEALEPDRAKALRYQPDFWLGERQAWLEIKSSYPKPPTLGEMRVARELLRAEGHPVYIVTGWPWFKSFGVYVFDPAGEVQAQRATWCELALCQLFDCGFNDLYAAFRAARNRGQK